MQRLAASIDAHDWTGLAALLHEDFPCRLVHTGETFDRDGDRDGWVRFNADYPGFDRFTLEGCIGEHDRAAGRAHSTGWVDDELNHFEVALFITVRDGLILDGARASSPIVNAMPVSIVAVLAAQSISRPTRQPSW